MLGQFINYFACAGQQSAARLGYSPMPKKLVQFAFAAENKVPGAPAPPAITPSACPNPTVTGDFKLGSSVASDNVLPYTDLGTKTYVQTNNTSTNNQSNNAASIPIDRHRPERNGVNGPGPTTRTPRPTRASPRRHRTAS